MPRAVYACSYENCTAIFRNSKRYKYHLQTHTGERPYKCTFDGCDKTYKTACHRKRHEDTHEKSFRCTIPGCSQILKTMATLMKHQDVFHPKKEAKKKYICSECSEEFSKHAMLTRHSYTHSGVQAYKCSEPDCDKSYSMPSLLKKHMKRHLGYFCEESDCCKYFPRWSLLRTHKKKCHPKTFKCNVCEKVFKLACNLKAHSLTHKLEKDIFRCTVPKCVRVYTSSRSLSDHIRTFHQTFTLSCPEGNCHRFLRTEKELEIHVNWRHRRRLNKKTTPKKKPEFAEILLGFAKGSKKDLYPPLSNAVAEEEVEDSGDETTEFGMMRRNSPNATQEDDDKQCLDSQDSKQNLNQYCSNIILEQKVEELKDETSEVEVMCLNSPDTIVNIEDEQCLDVQGSKQGLSPPLLKTASKAKVEKSKKEFMEIEVICNSLLGTSQGDEEQSSDGENYSFGCKAEADPSWISSDIPTGKVK